MLYGKIQKHLKNKIMKIELEDIEPIKEIKKVVVFDITEDEATTDWLQYGRAQRAENIKEMKRMEDNKMNKITIKEDEK